MPLEIKELHIKATLSDAGQGGRGGGASGGNSDDCCKEEMVNMCVDKVLQILKDKMER
ncbi:MAG: hypothetical protein HC896_05125 [Bacteroidales bacterium]|nr:hypothetical protein [Bacteroidales bacterium]